MRLFIILGIIFLGIGVFFFLFPKIPFLGKLPGDFLIRKKNFTFYFPLTTCILASIIISLLFFLFAKK